MDHSLKYIFSDTISAFEDTIKILQDSTLSREEKYDKILKKDTATGSCLYIKKHYTESEYTDFQNHLKMYRYNSSLYFRIEFFCTITSIFDSLFSCKGPFVEKYFEMLAISTTKERIEQLKLLKAKIS